MGESRFFEQGIQRRLREGKKISDVEQAKKQKRINEAGRVTKKWSTKSTPHFEEAKERGYTSRNATQKAKTGRLHPTWSSYR